MSPRCVKLQRHNICGKTRSDGVYIQRAPRSSPSIQNQKADAKAAPSLEACNGVSSRQCQVVRHPPGHVKTTLALPRQSRDREPLNARRSCLSRMQGSPAPFDWRNLACLSRDGECTHPLCRCQRERRLSHLNSQATTKTKNQKRQGRPKRTQQVGQTNGCSPPATLP